MSDIVWEEPPPSSEARAPAGLDIAEKLRANPGRWANIGERPSRSAAHARAHQIRNGLLIAFRPAGSFEAVARNVDGVYVVYARYVGPAQDAPEDRS